MSGVIKAKALTDDMEDEILDRLAEGYGVEDIAVDMKIEVQAVREFVFGLSAELRREVVRGTG